MASSGSASSASHNEIGAGTGSYESPEEDGAFGVAPGESQLRPHENYSLGTPSQYPGQSGSRSHIPSRSRSGSFTDRGEEPLDGVRNPHSALVIRGREKNGSHKERVARAIAAAQTEMDQRQLEFEAKCTQPVMYENIIRLVNATCPTAQAAHLCSAIRGIHVSCTATRAQVLAAVRSNAGNQGGSLVIADDDPALQIADLKNRLGFIAQVLDQLLEQVEIPKPLPLEEHIRSSSRYPTIGRLQASSSQMNSSPTSSPTASASPSASSSTNQTPPRQSAPKAREHPQEYFASLEGGGTGDDTAGGPGGVDGQNKPGCSIA